MVKVNFPKLETHALLMLGSTPLVKQINVVHFNELFGHFSCDTNLIKTYRPVARLQQVSNYEL